MPLPATLPDQPGASQLVAPSSQSSSGPASMSPGASSPRSRSGTSRHAPSNHTDAVSADALCATGTAALAAGGACAARTSIASAMTLAITSAGTFRRKTVQLPVRREEGFVQRRRVLPRQFDARVRPGQPDMRAAMQFDARGVDGLAQQVFPCRGGDRLQRASRSRVAVRGEVAFDRLPADRAPAGEADAVGGEHARQRMQQDLAHAERCGDRAGVLARRTAEAEQRESSGILPAMQRKFADRVGHARHGNAQAGVGERFDLVRRACVLARADGQFRQSPSRGVNVERFATAGAEDTRKPLRRNASERHVAVGDRGGSVTPIAGGSGIGARGLGPDLQAAVVEPQDRAAAGCDRVDIHERRLQAHAVDLGDEAARDLSGRETDVRRGAPHVETDQPARPVGHARGDHAHDTTRGPGQHSVDAPQARGIHESAIALHERHRGCAVLPGERGAELARVSQQQRRQVCVGDRGLAARDVAEQRCGFVRGHDLVEPEAARERGGAPLVLRKTEGMQERDRDRLDAGGARCDEHREQAGLVECLQHTPVRVHALAHRHDVTIERRRPANLAREDRGSFLVTDAQCVAHPGRRDEQRWRTAAFEQGIGCDRGAETHCAYDLSRASVHGEQRTDAPECGIVGMQWIPRQHLRRVQRAVRAESNDVRERPAAVHRESPRAGGLFVVGQQAQQSPHQRNDSFCQTSGHSCAEPSVFAVMRVVA